LDRMGPNPMDIHPEHPLSVSGLCPAASINCPNR
jgi:hypothetical protein